MLIRADRGMGLYEDQFSQRLSKLNDLRNGIHLRKQALLRKTLAKDHPFQHVYTQSALDDCKSCLEELRRNVVAEALPFGASQQRSMAKRANENFGYGENQRQTRTQNSPFTVGGLLSCDN